MMSTKVSERLCDRRDVYRRALADPVRFDVAFYAGRYVETLEAEVEQLRETLRAVLMVRDMPNTVENVARAALAAVSAEKEADSEY